MDPDSSPDSIIVSARHEEELSADRAELLLTVEGSSLVTGQAALTKAKEVSRLVEELARVGIDEGALSLEGVHAEVSSGLLSKSSSASYRLRVQVAQLESLPEVLGAVTGTKNVRLDHLLWRYPESVEKQAEWLQKSLREANLKAAAMAQALGTRLVGIRRCMEKPLSETAAQPVLGSEIVRMRKTASADLGFELTHKKRVGVAVTVEYRVEGFTPAG